MRPQSKCEGGLEGEANPRNIARWGERNARVLARNVSYGSTMNNADRDINMDCWKASGDAPGAANTNFTINHSLGRIPLTIVGQDTNNGGVLYRGSVAWTKTTVTLKCTVASSHYNVILA